MTTTTADERAIDTLQPAVVALATFTSNTLYGDDETYEAINDCSILMVLLLSAMNHDDLK